MAVGYRLTFKQFFGRNVPGLIAECLKRYLKPIVLVPDESAVPELVREYVTTETPDSVIRREKPKAVLALPDTDSDRGTDAVIAAKKRDTPTILIPSGIVRPVDCLPILSNKVAAYGEHCKQVYLTTGLSESRIAITGLPFWDDCFDLPRLKGEYVLFLTEDYRPIERTIEDLRHLRGLPFKVVVKFHPCEIYHAIISKEFMSDFMFVNGEDIVPWIRNANFVIGQDYSGAIVEALAMGKPVGLLHGNDEILPLLSSGAVANFREGNICELIEEATADRIRYERARECFLREVVLVDGRSAERIIDLALA